MEAPVKIVQISDVHLFGDTHKELLGVNTQDSFQAVVDLLKNDNYNPDLILLSGDLTQDGSLLAYQRLATILQPFNKPVYFIPGNHDNELTLSSVYPCDNVYIDKQILLPSWQIILLNSQIPGSVEGLLDDQQLAFMQQCLSQHPHRNTIIAFHHQPLPVGSKWLDPLGIQNPQKFWQLAQQYPQIKIVLFGHVHQEFETEHQGIHCYALPSTCIQFKPKQVDFALDHKPPGFRWITLHEDGTWQTGVKRTNHYVGHFDDNAKGY